MAAVPKRVLLGLRDAAVLGSPTGPGAWTASKLGGQADALPTVAAPRPVCERCGQPLALVVQAYCPLEGSPFHRLLHVFACARPKCGGGDGGARSWKVFRSQCLQVPEREARDAQKQEGGFAAENWCEGADDWGSDSEAPPPPLTLDLKNDSNIAQDIDWATRLQDLRLQDAGLGPAAPAPPGEALAFPPAPPGEALAFPPAPPGEGLAFPPAVPQFQPYYICVVDEDDCGDFVDLDHAHSLLKDYQQREGIDLEQLLSQSFSDNSGEKYEKTKIQSGDHMFYKFMKRIAACQKQILRYSWDGEPLFLTCPSLQVLEIPTCSCCGGRRIFEFQLMPALVSMLSSADAGLSVEFGTILVYTCEKSCWPPNHQTPVEEFCIKQEDPDESLFK